MTVAEATPDFEAVADRNDRAFLGHPKGLGYLAFIEACERFSYYSMQTPADALHGQLSAGAGADGRRDRARLAAVVAL